MYRSIKVVRFLIGIGLIFLSLKSPISAEGLNDDERRAVGALEGAFKNLKGMLNQDQYNHLMTDEDGSLSSPKTLIRLSTLAINLLKVAKKSSHTEWDILQAAWLAGTLIDVDRVIKKLKETNGIASTFITSFEPILDKHVSAVKKATQNLVIRGSALGPYNHLIHVGLLTHGNINIAEIAAYKALELALGLEYSNEVEAAVEDAYHRKSDPRLNGLLFTVFTQMNLNSIKRELPNFSGYPTLRAQAEQVLKTCQKGLVEVAKTFSDVRALE